MSRVLLISESMTSIIHYKVDEFSTFASSMNNCQTLFFNLMFACSLRRSVFCLLHWGRSHANLPIPFWNCNFLTHAKSFWKILFFGDFWITQYLISRFLKALGFALALEWVQLFELTIVYYFVTFMVMFSNFVSVKKDSIMIEF